MAILRAKPLPREPRSLAKAPRPVTRRPVLMRIYSTISSIKHIYSGMLARAFQTPPYPGQARPRLVSPTPRFIFHNITYTNSSG